MNYNILYKGRKIYTNLSLDECMDIIQEMAIEFYENGKYNPNEIELEEI
jgi:hypothetical protein